MPDETPTPPLTPRPGTPAEASTAPTPEAPGEWTGTSVSPGEGTSFNIGDEFGTAKRNLPPAKIVLVGVAIILVIAAIVSFTQRAKPQGGGSIDNVAVAEVPNQNMVMVAVNVTLRNTGEKPLWIRSIKGTLKTDSGEFSDDAASGVDFERYFQGFPALKQHAEAPLLPETKISAGGETRGTVIVTFPVTQDQFEKRKSLAIVIQPYDQPVPVVLTK